MRGIVKRYGPVLANDGIDLDVESGRIVGLLGENGSGKSTLMKVLFGMVAPDAGGIVFKGRELSRHDPKTAAALGIGMIHQHFMLVDQMSVTENVMLGWDGAGAWLRTAEVASRIAETSARLGLELDPDREVGTLSLGARQRVEILKAIIRGADLLVLDEPTSNLSPPEVDGLLDLMRRLRAEGRGIVFISHKLREVMAVCDEVVVLRNGRVSGRRPIAEASEADLAAMMVERDLSAPIAAGGAHAMGAPRLTLDGVALPGIAGSRISLSVRAGEILCLTGVDGNGQTELIETIAGMAKAGGGAVAIDGTDVTAEGVEARVAAGLATIPADRATTSLVQSMTIGTNLVLRDLSHPPLSRRGFLARGRIAARARELVGRFAIKAAAVEDRVEQLSGGNQQKIVVAREMARNPGVLIACQATWGLDPGATRFVHEQVLALREKGAAILYISSELDEAMVLGDRIGVLFRGRLMGIVDRAEIDIARIGAMMAGVGAPMTEAA